MSDRFAVLVQHLLPKLALTRFGGWVASARAGALTRALISWFVGRYHVDMSQAAEPDIGRYASFNDFFTRALRPGMRPIADVTLVSPVDGSVSQLGPVDADRIFQAKGHDYTTLALVGGDAELAAPFQGGWFVTLYLSPRDYHRIHMPCDGRLVRMIHVPGDLFSVSPVTARGVPGLFARNERVVCEFEGDDGPFVLVLVGATVVGSMATVWHGQVNPPRPGRIRQWRYDGPGDAPVRLMKGEEMGRFLLGSTVVMLFPPGPLRFNPEWTAGVPIRLGEPMAQRETPSPG